MSRRRGRLVFQLFLFVSCSLCALAEPPVAEPFPHYDSIRGNVDFWTSVFGEWSQGQVAVHDLEHPGVVYEVVDLPGQIESRYTEAQRDFVEDLNELWQDRLLTLERRAAAREELSDAEKGWALKLTAVAGSQALTDAHERVRTQRGLRERFRRGVEISYRYDAEMRQIFLDAGLPSDLAYLPHVESSFQAAARSSAGAVGVWQFTRGTGRRFMTINGTVDQRLDPIFAAHGAAAYLREAFDKLGNWPIALTSYNHGVQGMSRAVERLGADYEKIFNEYDGRSFGFASKNFYAEFLAARAIAREPERFFPEGLTPEAPLRRDRAVLESRTTPARLSRAYGLPVDLLASLNPAWTSRTVETNRALPKALTIWLPAGTLARMEQQGRTPDYTLVALEDGSGIHIVRKGDTLSGIAQAHGLSVSRLREINEIPGGESMIRAGQELRLFGGDDETVHVVRRGENLSRIAEDYGMRLATLRSMNGMGSQDSLIRAGQELRVLDRGRSIHIVRRGDTLIEIAASYGVKLGTLLIHNSLNTGSTIHPGQTLRIPSP